MEHPSPGSNPDRRIAMAMVLGAITSVQLGSAVATTLFENVGPAGAVLLRTLFAALALLAVRRPVLALLDRATVRDVLLFGVTLAGMNLCFYEALHRMPLGIAVTLEFTGPLAVAILASRSRADLLWATLAAGGILLFAPDLGNGLDPLGAAFALGAGAFWGSYILLSARVGRGMSGRGGLSLAMLVAAVLLIPPGVAGGGMELLDPGFAAIGAAIALLSSAIPYTLELEALRRLPEKTFGVLLSLEPAVAALIGAVLLGQALAGRELLAVALVVLASAGALRGAGTPEAGQP